MPGALRSAQGLGLALLVVGGLTFLYFNSSP